MSGGIKVRTGLVVPFQAGGRIAPHVDPPGDRGPGAWWWVVVAGALVAGVGALVIGWQW